MMRYIGDFIRMKAVNKYLPEGSGILLDAGCGLDMIYKPLVETKGYKWVGIDKDVDKKNIILKGDIINIPFEDNRFEAVISIDVIEHVESDLKAVQEVYRVLKPEGIAIFHVPNIGQSHILFDKPRANKDHVREGYEFGQLINLMEEAGFPHTEIYPTFELLEGLAWDLIRFENVKSTTAGKFACFLANLFANYDEKYYQHYGWIAKVIK